MQNEYEALRSTPTTEIAAVISSLKATVDREAWRTVADIAFLSDEPEAKEAGKQYFVEAAKLYTRFLSPTFHMIPWDSALLLSDKEFADAFQVAAETTSNFQNIEPEILARLLTAAPRTLAVLRMIAGYSRNQISFLVEREFDVAISGDVLRAAEKSPELMSGSAGSRWEAAVPHIASMLYQTVRGDFLPMRDGVETGKFRTLADKTDTRAGWKSVSKLANEGVPYWGLLYQRYVGGIFGQAINTSTSLKGDLLEGPVAKLLEDSGIPFYRVGAREKVPGWEQAPDFMIPDKENPVVVIESKVAEDGGTARDKASRIERLARLADAKGVIAVAVIDGLGFYRINDVLAPILGNCRGLVFSHSNLDDLLDIPVFAQLHG